MMAQLVFERVSSRWVECLHGRQPFLTCIFTGHTVCGERTADVLAGRLIVVAGSRAALPAAVSGGSFGAARGAAGVEILGADALGVRAACPVAVVGRPRNTCKVQLAWLYPDLLAESNGR